MLLIVTQEVKIQRDPLPAYGLRCLPRFQESLGLPYPRDAFFGCPTLRVVERPRREQRSRLKTKSRGPEKSGGSFLPTFPSTPAWSQPLQQPQNPRYAASDFEGANAKIPDRTRNPRRRPDVAPAASRGGREIVFRAAQSGAADPVGPQLRDRR